MANTLEKEGTPLLERVRGRLRTKRYSIRTEQQYVHWIKRFILYHGKRHPLQLGGRRYRRS